MKKRPELTKTRTRFQARASETPFLLKNLKQLTGAVLRSPDVGCAAVARREAREPESENQFEEAGNITQTQPQNTHPLHYLVLLQER